MKDYETYSIALKCSVSLRPDRAHQSEETLETDRQDECGYLEHIDGDGDDNIKQVPQCQTANQDIGSIPHALVLIYDPKQR